jgi:rod shape determining protein RodA
MVKRLLKGIHWPLLLSTFSLLAAGTLFIFSASYHDTGSYMTKQFFWVAVSLFLLWVIPFVGYRAFLNVSYLLYVFAIFSLVLVSVMGELRFGAQRWISIGAFVFQPSEFAKFATVLALANFLGSNMRGEKEKRVILAALAMVFLPFLLILKQPDLGSALLFLPLGAVALFLWGIRYRGLIFAVVSGAAAGPFLWQFLKEYQKKRILVFMNPNLDPLGAGYTAIQSKIAVGSGGLFGKGYLQGTQTQLQFVPEHHTDFIFCIIGEEWGYIGSLCLLLLYGLLFRSAFQIMEGTTDRRAKVMIGGVLAVLFSQVFINIGMTFGLMPVTGLTLPFVSYGGSSLIATSVGIGLMLSVYKERSIF